MNDSHDTSGSPGIGAQPPSFADATSPPDSTSSPRTSSPERRDPLRHSRTSGVWAAVLLLAVALLVLIVFIAQNTQDVEVSFFGWTGQSPLAVALLIAAVAGMVLVGTAAVLRMWQVRRRVRRDRA